MGVAKEAIAPQNSVNPPRNAQEVLAASLMYHKEKIKEAIAPPK